jgi:hypothetical protein
MRTNVTFFFIVLLFTSAGIYFYTSAPFEAYMNGTALSTNWRDYFQTSPQKFDMQAVALAINFVLILALSVVLYLAEFFRDRRVDQTIEHRKRAARRRYYHRRAQRRAAQKRALAKA